MAQQLQVGGIFGGEEDGGGGDGGGGGRRIEGRWWNEEHVKDTRGNTCTWNIFQAMGIWISIKLLLMYKDKETNWNPFLIYDITDRSAS